MLSARLILPAAEAYSRHAGMRVERQELRSELGRRLSWSPPWARALLCAGALFLRWLAPLLVLRRFSRFESLGVIEREELLARLQRDRRLLVRGPFLGVKTLLLGCCYGRAQSLARIGYRAGEASRDA